MVAEDWIGDEVNKNELPALEIADMCSRPLSINSGSMGIQQVEGGR